MQNYRLYTDVNQRGFHTPDRSSPIRIQFIRLHSKKQTFFLIFSTQPPIYISPQNPVCFSAGIQKAAPDSHPVPPCLKVSELSSGLNRLNQLMRCRNMPVRIQRILTETVNLMSGKQQIVVCLAVMADVKQSLMNAVSSRVADFPRRPVRPRPGRELALRQTAQTFRPVVFHRCPFFRRQETTVLSGVS